MSAVEPSSRRGITGAASEAEPTSVVDKIVLILQACGSGVELSLAELVEITGLPRSTTYRLARTLVDNKLLEHSDGRYSIGLFTFELARSLKLHREIRELALPFLQDLYEATHEIIHLGVRNGRDVVYLEKLSGHSRTPRSSTLVGGRKPLHCTALGKALLAFGPPDAIEGVLAAPLEPLTRQTIVVPGVLREQLEEIRKMGVAYDRGEVKLGIVCVAAPILDTDGFAIAAVSITGPSTRFDPERHRSAVRAAARGIQRAIGLSPL